MMKKYSETEDRRTLFLKHKKKNYKTAFVSALESEKIDDQTYISL